MRSEKVGIDSVAVRHLALFSPCRHCRCAGFRPVIEGAPDNFERKNGIFYFDLHAYGDFHLNEVCKKCEHDLRDHTSAALTMNKKYLLYYSQMVRDAYLLSQLLRAELDRYRFKLYAKAYEKMLQALRRSIYTSRRIVLFKETLEEPTTSAVHILTLFVLNITKENKEERPRMFRMLNLFLTKMNEWEPETPDKVHKSENIDLKVYKILYASWFFKVFLPQTFSSLRQHQAPEVLGLWGLLMFMRDYMQENKANRKVDPVYLFASALAKNILTLKKCSSGEETPSPSIMKCISFERHPQDKYHRDESPTKLHSEKKNVGDSDNLELFNHTQMMSAIVRIVELERADMFVTEEKKEDKMSADVAKSEIVQQEVEAGIVRFLFVKNELDACQSPADLVWLVQLKTLFNAQLPKMGADYITRLVFDESHHNLALIRNCKVIGGCCFRPFPEQKFVEIVFLAVSSHDQIKGYGTILMNYMKDFAVRRGMHMLLTFADSFATGYFKKQGFSDEIDFPKKSYEGFIKEYEGATLMACQLHPMIRYTSFAAYIKGVRDMQAALNTFINPIRTDVLPGIGKLCKKYDKRGIAIPFDKIPGLTSDPQVKGFKLESSFSESENLDDSDQSDGEDEEGNRELDDTMSDVSVTPVSSLHGRRKKSKKRRRLLLEHQEPKTMNLRRRMQLFLIELGEDPNSWPFLYPVGEEDCPEYHEYVKYPSCLELMHERLRDRYYKHQRLFFADLCRIFANCFSFNAPDTEYWKSGYMLNIKAIELLAQYFPGCDIFPHLPEAEEGYDVDFLIDEDDLIKQIAKRHKSNNLDDSSDSEEESDSDSDREHSKQNGIALEDDSDDGESVDDDDEMESDVEEDGETDDEEDEEEEEDQDVEDDEGGQDVSDQEDKEGEYESDVPIDEEEEEQVESGEEDEDEEMEERNSLAGTDQDEDSENLLMQRRNHADIMTSDESD